jgi:excisionase family DNA binding protein
MWYNVEAEQHEGGRMEQPLTVAEAATELGYHVKHVYRLLKSGRLRGERFGPLWMIPRPEVERVKALQDERGRLPRAGPSK